MDLAEQPGSVFVAQPPATGDGKIRRENKVFLGLSPEHTRESLICLADWEHRMMRSNKQWASCSICRNTPQPVVRTGARVVIVVPGAAS